MLKSDFKNSIRYKFLKNVSLILLVNLLVLSTVIAVKVGAALDNALTDKAHSYATTIAKRNENALIMTGSTRLHSVYSELITDEDIIYTIVQNESGEILTTQFESINFKWTGLMDVLPMITKESELPDIIQAIKQYVDVQEVSVPIMIGTDKLGSVSIGISKGKINNQILKTLLFVIAMNLIAAFFLGLVLFITSRKTIMDPISELGHAAMHLAKGDLSVEVKIHAVGEIQLLVNSFNQMAADLRKTTVSKDYVDNIISSLSDTLIVVSPDGTIMLANDAACSLLGYDRLELIGRTFDMVLARQFSVKRMLDRILGATPIRNIELQYVTKHGATVPMLFSGSVMSSYAGKLRSVVFAATDITDRKKSEEALRDANERLTATLQASPAAIMTLSAVGIVTMWNNAAERIFGWSRDEIIGKQYPMILDEDQEKFRLLRERILNGASFVDAEVRQKRKNNTIADISLSAAPLHDSHGARSNIMLVMSDITDRKKLEGDLLRAQKLESIGVLAGGIAHDFNNILTAILGNINLAKMSLTPDQESYARLALAEQATLRATGLTHQLLTFSRGGAPVKKTISIGEIIQEAASFSLRGSHVNCEFNLADDLWLIEADEGQISQVIHNLVINANQAMPEGGAIHICAENTALDATAGLPLNEGNYVQITIEDHGVGIPTEQLKKIFDPYFTTKQSGSGLGLAIAYSIIKNHDGYITVQSTMGVGTIFTILLPASESKTTQKKPTAEKLVCGKGTILVMDDDEMLRNVAGALLITLGYKVEYAKDGEEAVKSYAAARDEARPFDAVIMDLTIPGGMGGKEAIQKLRAIDPHVKAIVSSGYSQDAVMANYRDYGFVGVISKPYKITDLGVILNEALNGASP